MLNRTDRQSALARHDRSSLREHSGTDGSEASAIDASAFSIANRGLLGRNVVPQHSGILRTSADAVTDVATPRPVSQSARFSTAAPQTLVRSASTAHGAAPAAAFGALTAIPASQRRSGLAHETSSEPAEEEDEVFFDSLQEQPAEDDIGTLYDVPLDSDTESMHTAHSMRSDYTAHSMRSDYTASSMDSMRAMYGADSMRAPSLEHHVIAIPEAEPRAGANREAATAAPRTAKPAIAPYLKATSYLIGSLGTLTSAVGWILLRDVPLMQPIGQALASALKNGFGSADEYYKENTPKVIGQALSASGQLVGIAGIGAVNATKNTRLTGMRAAAAAINGTGMMFTGVGERRKQDLWKAGSNFVGAALNLVGTIGYAIEAAGHASTALLVLGGINTFNNTATPLGGAVDDSRKSKVEQPWLRDPKVAGQEIANLGFALNAIASTMNKVYAMKDKENGTQDSQHYTQLISALGATGMFMATVGYVVSTYAELPKKPARPAPDLPA